MNNFMQEYFSGFGYAQMLGSEPPTAAETNFGLEWHEKYFEQKFYNIDPVFKFNDQCRNRSGVKLLRSTEMESSLFEEARVFGADSNFISVSIFGGNRMVFGGVNHDLDERVLPALQKACQAAHRGLLLANVDKLSDTQIDFMEMSEEGMRDKQIAAELDVSLSAIAQRKKVISSKLGTVTFSAALSLYSMRKWGGIVPISDHNTYRNS